jgi:hypothetical protein
MNNSLKIGDIEMTYRNRRRNRPTVSTTTAKRRMAAKARAYFAAKKDA